MVKFFVGINFSSVKSDEFFLRWRKLLPTKKLMTTKIITDKVFTNKVRGLLNKFSQSMRSLALDHSQAAALRCSLKWIPWKNLSEFLRNQCFRVNTCNCTYSSYFAVVSWCKPIQIVVLQKALHLKVSTWNKYQRCFLD